MGPQTFILKACFVASVIYPFVAMYRVEKVLLFLLLLSLRSDFSFVQVQFLMKVSFGCVERRFYYKHSRAVYPPLTLIR